MGHPVSTPFTTPRTSTEQTLYFTSEDNDDATEQAAKIEEVIVKPKTTTSTFNTETPNSSPDDIEVFTESMEETTLRAISITEQSTNSVSEIITLSSTSVMTLPSTSAPSTTTISTKEEIRKASATPLSALLVPGGQQQAFKISGRPTITKVASPHLSSTAPLSANLQTADLIETAAQSKGQATQDYRSIETSTKADTSWYFANYNKTSLEPFVGSVSHIPSCGQGKPQASFGFWFCIPGLILLIN